MTQIARAVVLPAALTGASREAVRSSLQRVLGIAAFACRFTPTPKDDAAVALLQTVVDDDALFNGVMDLLGVP